MSPTLAYRESVPEETKETLESLGFAASTWPGNRATLKNKRAAIETIWKSAPRNITGFIIVKICFDTWRIKSN